MVELRADSAAPEPPAGGLFGPALAARLRDWLDQGRPRDAAPIDAKVVLFAVGAGGGARSRRCSRGCRASSRPLGVVGRRVAVALRIPVDDEVGDRTVRDAVRRPRFAAVWPLAAHGALATWFVHGSGVEASVSALRAAIDQVGALPRARCFHLLLDEKDRDGDRMLCEKLGLFDDRHALAISAERASGRPALRDLLTRCCHRAGDSRRAARIR